MRLRTLTWKSDRMSGVRLLNEMAMAVHRLNDAGAFIIARGDRWEVRWVCDHDEVAA